MRLLVSIRPHFSLVVPVRIPAFDTFMLSPKQLVYAYFDCPGCHVTRQHYLLFGTSESISLEVLFWDGIPRLRVVGVLAGASAVTLPGR